MGITVSQEAMDLHRRAIVVDLHCDLLLTTFFLGWDWKRRHRNNPFPGAPLMGHVDLPRARAGGLTGMSLGVVTHPWRGRSGPRAVDRALDDLGRVIRENPDELLLARSAADLRQAKAEGRIAVMAGLEGTHPMDRRLDLLPVWKEAGLLSVGLVHFSRNAAARPMTGWGSNPGLGLSDWGRELLDECTRLGLLIDVAHLNRAGLQEVCTRARAPVICTHTAMNAVFRSPRGIDDEQALAVARTGGVVGIIFAPDYLGGSGMEALVAHLGHLRDVVGAEACAIGSDWEGWVTFLRDLDSVEALPRLTQALLDAHWKPDDVLDVLGGSFLRMLEGIAL